MKVVDLKSRSWAGEVDESVLAVLRDCLVQAERGEFRSIAIVALCRSGGSQHYVSKSEKFNEMLGALAMMQFDMQQRHNDE